MNIIQIESEIIDLPKEEFLNHIFNLTPNVNLIYTEYNTPLIFSLIQKNKLDLIERLSELDLNIMYGNMETPLHRACRIFNLEIAIYLLERGANPNSRNGRGYTPFHFSCVDRKKMSSLFLSNGANINEKTNEGLTGLHISCKYGYSNMVKFLLQNGAIVEYENGEPTCLKDTKFIPHITEEKINELSDIIFRHQMKNVKGIPRKD